jgi:LacI family transcriptional regulator
MVAFMPKRNQSSLRMDLASLRKLIANSRCQSRILELSKFGVQDQMPQHRPITLAYQIPVLSQNAQAGLRGVCSYVRLHADWHLRIASESLSRVIPMLKARGVDGAFVHPASKAEEELVAGCGIPCILTHTTAPQKILPYFTANNRLLGKMGAEHFIQKGFTSFAYYSLNNDLFWSRERLDGFTERVQKAGGTVHVFEPLAARARTMPAPRRDSLQWPPSSWLQNAEHLRGWLLSLPKPTGVMATDDGMGYDIIEACEEAGIKVPEELAVLGTYNDLTRCLLSNPPLSSIALDLEQSSYNAAALLHRIILGKEKMRGQRQVNEPTHIVTRQSSDILAVSDPDLAAALHFIRTNFNRPIKVADVVKQTSASRRSLEIKFREFIKHSITDEIMRVKVDQIAHMLLESDMSMERIADCLAFCSSGVMRKAFRRARGTNPMDFRREHRKT